MEFYKNLSLENLTTVYDGVEYTEEWRDIPKYEGWYQVSSFGRIKSLDRMIKCAIRRDVFAPSKIRKIGLDDHRYPSVNICKEGSWTRRVHKWVGDVFIPNPENKPHINHKDAVRHNNFFLNLEWSTVQENVRHSWDMDLCTPMRGALNGMARAVVRIDKEGNRKMYSNMSDAVEDLGKKRSRCSYVGAVCNGTYPNAFGYKWEYFNEQKV